VGSGGPGRTLGQMGAKGWRMMSLVAACRTRGVGVFMHACGVGVAGPGTSRGWWHSVGGVGGQSLGGSMD